jgi:AcrR family transcriptional regulator
VQKDRSSDRGAGQPRKRGRPDPAENEEVLARLRRVAYRHFMVNGVDDASLLSIAREVGVSRQMIHNHFGNKQQFFDALFKNTAPHLQSRFGIEAMPTASDPWVVFNYLGNEFCNIELDPDGIEIFRVMNVATYRYPEIAAVHAADLETAYRFIAKQLRAAGRACGVELSDLRGASRDFLALIEGYVLPVLQGRSERPSPQAQAREIAAIVRRYLRGLGFDESQRRKDSIR